MAKERPAFVCKRRSTSSQNKEFHRQYRPDLRLSRRAFGLRSRRTTPRRPPCYYISRGLRQHARIASKFPAYLLMPLTLLGRCAANGDTEGRDGGFFSWTR
jgi:hypothetical protein